MIQTVYLYYDNPRMLQFQIDVWNSYVGVLKCLPEVLLVDDGSPQTSAAEVVKEFSCKLPIKVFRIKEDIPWNMPGARNLGCFHAHDWIYMSDIDTILPPEGARCLFESEPLKKDTCYMPRRVYLPSLTEAEPAIVNLLYHKELYFRIGCYDEDYAGFYGKEELDFISRIKSAATFVERSDATVQVVSPELISDAQTRGRIRDSMRNNIFFAHKRAGGFARPINPLRFTWERIL